MMTTRDHTITMPPPEAPSQVRATVGNGEAKISWSYTGFGSSMPSLFRVDVSPGTQQCLAVAPATECVLTGLSNGVTYTARVSAFNIAGWSRFSSPSEPFTPVGAPGTPDGASGQPAKVILISATSAARARMTMVRITGTASGLESKFVRAQIRLAGEPFYQQGVARLVDSSGKFEWSRKANRSIEVYFTTGDRGVRSNTLRLDPR